MKKKVLLTSMGGIASYEFVTSFNNSEDLELFICDSNSNSNATLVTKNFFSVLPGSDENYSKDLLSKMKKFEIDMVIPGSDEEAFSIMENLELFEKEGIIAAVQKKENLPYLQSKTAMYEYLKQFDIKLPNYKSINSKDSLVSSCEEFGLNNGKQLLIKPVQERGGRDIFVVSQSPSELKENLLNLTLEEFIAEYYDENREYVLMDYIIGTVYDIDVLKYGNGEVYFGSRKRFTNITKNFFGNIFDFDSKIIEFSKKLYECFPSEFLLDYDLMITEDKEIYLLEVNPRPSGSLISYLPFNVNIYEILAKSYLLNQHQEVKDLHNKKSIAFFKMIGSEC